MRGADGAKRTLAQRLGRGNIRKRILRLIVIGDSAAAVLSEIAEFALQIGHQTGAVGDAFWAKRSGQPGADVKLHQVRHEIKHDEKGHSAIEAMERMHVANSLGWNEIAA